MIWEPEMTLIWFPMRYYKAVCVPLQMNDTPTHTNTMLLMGETVTTGGYESPNTLLAWPSYCLMVCIIICKTATQRHQSFEQMEERQLMREGEYRPNKFQRDISISCRVQR